MRFCNHISDRSYMIFAQNVLLMSSCRRSIIYHFHSPFPPQRILELELEVETLRNSEEEASDCLARVLSRADALGLLSTLQQADPTPLDDAVSRNPEANVTMCVESSLPQIQDACRRWLLTSAALVSETIDPWHRPADHVELMRSLGESRRLVQQQQQVRRSYCEDLFPLIPSDTFPKNMNG